MGRWGAALIAGLAVLAAPLADASASSPLRSGGPQVLIHARIAEISTEFSAGLGVDFNRPKGSYESTSNEEPGSNVSTLLNGFGSVGGTLWFNTHLLAPHVDSSDGLNAGIGVEASGFFGGDDDILQLPRHHGNDIVDTVLSRSVNYTVDITGRASIPIVVRPRLSPNGDDVILFIEPFAGVSVIGTDTKLASDRGGANGVLEGAKTGTEIGVVTGIGVVTELGKIPIFGDIPVLGGLFYKARQVPGTSASVTAGGVTETGRVDSSWQHEAMFVLITPFLVTDERP